MAYENALGGFANGMAGGMSLGMKYQDRQEERQLEEERRRRDEETRRQQEQTSAQIQSQSQPSQQGGMSIRPSMVQQFMPSGAGAASGAGSAGSAGGAATGAGQAGGMSVLGGSGAGTGAAGAGGAAGGGAGASGALAAAGPWAALAAIIAVNEKSAHNSGDRRTGWTGMKDFAGGKVVEQDAHGNRIQKVLGSQENDKTGLANDAAAAGDLTTFDFKNGIESASKGVGGRLIKSTVGKLFK